MYFDGNGSLSLHNMSSLYFMAAWVFWFLVNRLFLSGRESQGSNYHSRLSLHSALAWDLCRLLLVSQSQPPPPGLRCPELHRMCRVPGQGPSVCLRVILETQVGHRSADHLHDNRALVWPELIGIHQRNAVSRCHKPPPDTSDSLNKFNLKMQL